MMADSTNAGKKGVYRRENSWHNLITFAEAESRIIIATFASKCLQSAENNRRSGEMKGGVAMSGSEHGKNVVATATELGYMKVPKARLLQI